MKAGSLKFYFIFIIFQFFSHNLISQEKLILEDIQPTFEEDIENSSNENNNYNLKLKSKDIKKNQTGNIIVKLKALDKITAKTSDINIPVGKKKKIWIFRNFAKKMITILF